MAVPAKARKRGKRRVAPQHDIEDTPKTAAEEAIAKLQAAIDFQPEWDDDPFSNLFALLVDLRDAYIIPARWTVLLEKIKAAEEEKATAVAAAGMRRVVDLDDVEDGLVEEHLATLKSRLSGLSRALTRTLQQSDRAFTRLSFGGLPAAKGLLMKLSGRKEGEEKDDAGATVMGGLLASLAAMGEITEEVVEELLSKLNADWQARFDHLTDEFNEMTLNRDHLVPFVDNLRFCQEQLARETRLRSRREHLSKALLTLLEQQRCTSGDLECRLIQMDSKIHEATVDRRYRLRKMFRLKEYEVNLWRKKESFRSWCDYLRMALEERSAEEKERRIQREFDRLNGIIAERDTRIAFLEDELADREAHIERHINDRLVMGSKILRKVVPMTHSLLTFVWTNWLRIRKDLRYERLLEIQTKEVQTHAALGRKLRATVEELTRRLQTAVYVRDEKIVNLKEELLREQRERAEERIRLLREKEDAIRYERDVAEREYMRLKNIIQDLESEVSSLEEEIRTDNRFLALEKYIRVLEEKVANPPRLDGYDVVPGEQGIHCMACSQRVVYRDLVNPVSPTCSTRPFATKTMSTTAPITAGFCQGPGRRTLAQLRARSEARRFARPSSVPDGLVGLKKQWKVAWQQL
mmetsp:Transcript_52521/g.115202  ORF Transcript_52521/g.115202 Transcript_52521/m.115202 type:complete len:636 (-) Transcript_52521:56-1963(-)